MQHFKIMSIYCCLLFINLVLGQDFKEIPDSLKKYSYEDLTNIIDKKWKKGEETILYSKIFLSKAKKENNSRKIISAFVWMGIEANNFQLNIKYSDSAISLAKKENLDNLPDLYWGKANIYYNQKRLKEALNCYLMADECPNKSIELAENINFYIGVIKSMQGEYLEAISIFKKCEEHPSAKKFSDYPRYLLALSENYNRINEINASNRYITKGISICNKTPNFNYYLPYFISNRGKNFYKLSQYNNSLKDLTSQLKLIKDNNDFSNYAENSFFIGECYRSKHLDDKAVEYYKKVDSVFSKKKDIYPIMMSTYQHLIDYYKKKEDYQQVIYYSDQFIKADKVIDENYKYITSTISKKYDIQKIVAGKQAVISNLNSDKKVSSITIFLLLIFLIPLIVFLYYKNKKRKKELAEQKLLFEEYKEREAKIKKEKENEKLQIAESKRKLKATDLDKKIVAYILHCFDIFEKEEWYLKEEEYTLQSLSVLWNTNQNYLSRVLNDIKNMSFTQYINTLRITYIIDKIENEKFYIDYTIQVLSDSCGYNNVQTFNRAFKEYTKMKPSDFINQLKNKRLKNKIAINS